MKARAPLQLLLRPAGSLPTLPGGLPAESLSADRAPGLRAASSVEGYLWDEGEDGNDLRAQRWGVVAPQGAVGDRLLAQLAPLIARRQDEQGQKVRIYRPPPRLDDDEAAQYRREHMDSGDELAAHLPRYLLLLGDLHEVPLSLQQVLQTDALVGRLAFSDPAGYEAYVDKLLRSEREPPSAPGQALLYAVPDGTDATSVGYDSLVAPSLDLVARNPGDLSGRVRSLNDESGDVLSPSPLVQAARAAQPSVLLSVSHGEGPPEGGYRSPEQQRRRQGAMRFGDDTALTADDLAGQRFLARGLWLMVACYGAGTPSDSSYRPWLDRLAPQRSSGTGLSAVLSGLPQAGERPFVAALPQAVLASRDGPLGFVGHIDLAWTYSFADLDRGAQAVPRPARFVSALRAALRGDRLGLCTRELMRAVGQAQTELLSLQLKSALLGQAGSPARASTTRAGSLWMLRQDLLGYVLLGDPAARLPVARGGLAASPVESPADGRDDRQAQLAAAAAELGLPLSSLSAMSSTAPASPRRPTSATARIEAGSASSSARLPVPLALLEPALGQALAGTRDPAVLAADLGLPLATFQALLDRYRSAGRSALLAGGEDPRRR